MPKKVATLSPMQKAFVREYYMCGHMGKAYIAAGFKAKDITQASGRASALLKKPLIIAYLNKLQDSAFERTAVSGAKIINKMAQIAFGDLGEVIEIDESGDLSIKPEADLSNLDSIGFSKSDSRSDNDDGSSVSKSRSFNVKRSERKWALEQLAKIAGLYDEQGNTKENSFTRTKGLVEGIKRLGKGRESR